MPDLLFYLFAALTLAAAVGVVASRNAVNAAMSLFLTFAGMAGLFVLLGAYFLAVLQVLVYAGAVVVLFVFIVMLLDVDKQQRKPISIVTGLASFVAFCLMAMGVVWLFARDQFTGPALPAEAVGATLKIYGRQLFTTYLLPMQVTGFLLLVAMIGVIVISRGARSERRGQVTSGK
jgi:NADH-quinone oxidoreductase subunit J